MKRFLSFFLFSLIVSVPAVAAQKRYEVPIGDSPQRGPANAPVTIVEFLDYQ